MLAALLFLSAATASANSSPVSKVIKLLRDMQGQLEADKAKEEEMFDKLSCWCKVNGDGKAEAVATATSQLASLSSQSKALSAKASELEQSLQQLGEEMAANQAALDKATAMRDKEHGAFNANEKDLLLSIDSLKHALAVMAKSQGEAFLQTSITTARASVRGVLEATAANDVLREILAPTDRVTLSEFLQGGEGYEPASGEIMGVLKQMREEFASNLQDMQDREATAAKDFAALDSAKSAEIAAAEKQTKEKTAQLGRTKVALAEAAEDREDTEAALEADQAFLVDLKERCANSDAEWEQRSATRAKEMSAVGEAIGILTDEDAHDLFHKTLTFLQLSSTRRATTKAQRARESASRILLRAATKSGSRALVQLASSARLDGFAAVTDDINGMIADLRKESKEEVKHKDFCNTEFHNNEMETIANTQATKDLTTKINDLKSVLETLDNEIAATKAAVKDSEVELQRANENRQKQNSAFQQTVADQRATQVILKKAMDRLQQFYDFVQLHEAHKVVQPNKPGAKVEAMPKGFGEYKSNSGSGSVLTMIGGIITDAKEAEEEAIKAENDAEAAYVSFAGETFTSIEGAAKAITNKVEQRANAESAKVAAEGDKDAANASAEALANKKADLHAACDFVLQNFDARQAARGAEVESLQAAIAALRTA